MAELYWDYEKSFLSFIHEREDIDFVDPLELLATVESAQG